jgi:hypothetical protein
VRGIGTIKLALAASITTLQIVLACNLNPLSLPASQVLELKILSADGRQTVGWTHFRLSSDSASETIELESRYLDGQHDEEQDRVLSIDGKLRLPSYEHTFFGADGKTIMVDKFDAISRIATCSRREDGKMRLRSFQLDFSADMFCGATQLLIVTTNLRAGSRNINFHALACIPGPRVFLSLLRFRSIPNDGPTIQAILYASICGPTLVLALISSSRRSCQRLTPGSIRTITGDMSVASSTATLAVLMYIRSSSNHTDECQPFPSSADKSHPAAHAHPLPAVISPTHLLSHAHLVRWFYSDTYRVLVLWATKQSHRFV